MKNDVYGIVYKATNKVNDNIYIGQTTQSLDNRIIRHLWDYTNGSNSLGFIWIYEDDYNEELLNTRIENYKKSLKNKIVQLSKDGEIINEFDSAKNCADSINGDSSSVIKCCRGKLKTHKGYIFKYKNEVE